MQGCPRCTQNMAEVGTMPRGWGVAPASYFPQTNSWSLPQPVQEKSPADLSPSPQIKAFPCWIAPWLLLLLLLLPLPPVSSVLPGPPSSRIIIPGHLAAAPQCSCRRPAAFSPYLEAADGGSDTAVGEQQGAELEEWLFWCHPQPKSPRQ